MIGSRALLVMSALAAASISPISGVTGKERQMPMVRIAELEIDPAQLDAYKALFSEEQEASVRLEPGVLMLHSVSLGDEQARIRLLEVYADEAAYKAHLRSPHFLKYKSGTAAMVRSLTLREAVPIALCSKNTLASGSHCLGEGEFQR